MHAFYCLSVHFENTKNDFNVSLYFVKSLTVSSQSRNIQNYKLIISNFLLTLMELFSGLFDDFAFIHRLYDKI